MVSYLEELVLQRCRQLGDKAPEFFGVSPGHIKQWRTGSKRPSLAAVQKVFVDPPSKQVEANWEHKDVELCLPMYKQTNPLTVAALFRMYDRTKMGFSLDHGDAFIVHAREALAHKFLEGGKPWSLWVDDDMIVPCGDAALYRKLTGFNFPDEFAGLHTINRLLSHNKMIVGGLYFGRRPHGRAMYYEALVDSPEGAIENARAHSAPFDELRPAKWVGTGCVLIHRQVFLDIKEKNPHLAPMHPFEPFHFFTNASDGAMSRFNAYNAAVRAASEANLEENHAEAGEKLREAVRLLAEAKTDVLHNSHLMQGEDQTFGIRAGLAGHQTYVDLGLVCGHIGSAVYGPHNTRETSPIHLNNV